MVAAVADVPLLVVAATRDHAMLLLGVPLLAVAGCVAVVLAWILARWVARPVEELAEAAGRSAPVTRGRSGAGTG